MVQALEHRFKLKVHVPKYYEHVFALGAALPARHHL